MKLKPAPKIKSIQLLQKDFKLNFYLAPYFSGPGDSSTRRQCGLHWLSGLLSYLVMIYTLHLGLGDLPTGLGGCDSGGTSGIHKRSLQYACPVLLAGSQIALPPSLEVILALSCTHKT